MTRGHCGGTTPRGVGLEAVRAACWLVLSASMVVGCRGPASEPNDTEANPEDSETVCRPDASNALDNAYSINGTEALGDTICPRRDRDFWRLQTQVPNQVVGVSVDYEKLGNLRLSADWWWNVGVCVPSDVGSCSGAEDCAQGRACDTARGICRPPEAARCFKDDDCTAAEQCSMARELFTTVVEPLEQASAQRHRVTTSLPAPVAGDYFLTVYDLTERVEDASTEYTLEVAPRPDPDPGEPNGSRGMATRLEAPAGGDAVTHTGYLAFEEDTDWFFVQPETPLSSRAVIHIELAWPDFGDTNPAQLNPSWELQQGEWRFPAPEFKTRGSGQDAERYRAARVVAPDSSGFYVRVQRTRGSFDAENPYRLTLRVQEDADEGGNRNDRPGSATQVEASSFGEVYQSDHTLLAGNDVDWYRIDKGTGSALSLLNVEARVSDPADYLLRLLFYTRTEKSCSADSECLPGLCLQDAGVCIEPNGVQRPAPGGPGDPQLGGLSPSYRVTQQPLFGNGDGTLYIRVSHIDETFLDLPGYGDTPYTLTLKHIAEPETFEHDATPAELVAQPVGADASAFESARRPKVVPSQLSNGAEPDGWVSVAPGAQGVIGGCQQIRLQAFAGNAEPQTNAVEVEVSVSPGELVDNCTDQNSLTNPLSLTDETTVGLTIPADATASEATITTEGAALATIETPVTLAEQPLPHFTFAAEAVANDRPAPRRVLAGKSPPAVYLRASEPAAAELPVQISVAAPVGSASRLRPLQVEPYTYCSCDDTFGPLEACAAAACKQSIARGGSLLTEPLRVTREDPGHIRITARANGYAASSWVLAAAAGQQLVQDGTGLSAAGHISYDADQDWFEFAAGELPAAMARLEVSYAASPVDLRVRVVRGNAATGIGRTDDTCASSSCGPGATCDGDNDDTPRFTCDQGPFATADPSELDPEQDCSYLDSEADTVYVWLNDVLFNDWDTSAEYSFRLELEEGCSLACPVAVCNQ